MTMERTSRETQVNLLVATAAQFYGTHDARESMKRWAKNARLWHRAQDRAARDRCIKRAQVMQARVVEMKGGQV